MTYKYPLILMLCLLMSCSQEKEILVFGTSDPLDHVIGQYTFALTVNYGTIQPNISGYLPPKKFATEILRSENNKEISILNMHDVGTCVYATVNDNNIDIPLQNLNLMEEVFGFNIIPDEPEKTVFIKGSGSLIETPRSDSEPIQWKMVIEYQLTYDGIPIWNISGHSEREPISGDMEFTCK